MCTISLIRYFNIRNEKADHIYEQWGFNCVGVHRWYHLVALLRHWMFWFIIHLDVWYVRIPPPHGRSKHFRLVVWEVGTTGNSFIWFSPLGSFLRPMELMEPAYSLVLTSYMYLAWRSTACCPMHIYNTISWVCIQTNKMNRSVSNQ